MPFQLAFEEAVPENNSDISSTVLRWEDLPVRSELLSNGDTTLEEIFCEDADDDWYEDRDDAQNEDDWLSDSSEMHIYCDHEDMGYSSDISGEHFKDEPSDAMMHIVDSPPSSPTVWHLVPFTFIALTTIALDVYEQPRKHQLRKRAAYSSRPIRNCEPLLG